MADDEYHRALLQMETQENFLRKIDKINVWTCRDQQAPHKPFLLLLAFGRLVGGKERLASFNELEPLLLDLLDRFGPRTEIARFGPRTERDHPEDPFWRLRNDRLKNDRLENNFLWEVWNGKNLMPPDSSKPPKTSDLRNYKGGFPQPVYDQLHVDRTLLEEATKKLLYENFHVLRHNQIREAVGLPLDRERWRSADWPFDFEICKEILCAYECRCAVCDFDISLDDGPVGLEAVHIKWHVAGGPSKAENGLALCATHQKAFVRGAFGLISQAEDYKIVVSEQIKGKSNSARELRGMRNELLRLPRNGLLAPNPEYIGWHHARVFLG